MIFAWSSRNIQRWWERKEGRENFKRMATKGNEGNEAKRWLGFQDRRGLRVGGLGRRPKRAGGPRRGPGAGPPAAACVLG